VREKSVTKSRYDLGFEREFSVKCYVGVEAFARGFLAKFAAFSGCDEGFLKKSDENTTVLAILYSFDFHFF
jgi:hypothetical protein